MRYSKMAGVVPIALALILALGTASASAATWGDLPAKSGSNVGPAVTTNMGYSSVVTATLTTEVWFDGGIYYYFLLVTPQMDLDDYSSFGTGIFAPAGWTGDYGWSTADVQAADTTNGPGDSTAFDFDVGNDGSLSWTITDGWDWYVDGTGGIEFWYASTIEPGWNMYSLVNGGGANGYGYAPVPTPTAIALGLPLLGMLGVGTILRRRRKLL